MLVLNRTEKNSANPRFLRVAARNPKKGEVGLTNEGFRGMGIKQGLRYDFSVLYRQQNPGIKIHLELADSAGNAEFVEKLTQLHDHKGTLIVFWQAPPTGEEQDYFARAWASKVGDGMKVTRLANSGLVRMPSGDPNGGATRSR